MPAESAGILARMLAQRARLAPQSEAVHDLGTGQRVTWLDLQSDSMRLAHGLAASGVREGDRIAVVCPRTAHYVAALAACWAVGATAVPLDPSSPEAELDGFLRHSEARLVLTDHAALATPGGMGILEAGSGSILRRCGPPTAPSPRGDAILLYTSGSTGAPKAARLTHRGILASLHGLARACRLGPQSRILSTLPLFTSHGLFVHALSPLVHGGTLLLHPLLGPFQAPPIWEVAREVGATFFSSVPSVLAVLLDMARGMPPPQLRIYSASSPLPESLRDAFRERFAAGIANSFGMSEACSWFLYGEENAPPGAAGRPLRCAVRLVSAKAEGEADDRTELCIRGTQVTPGYWRPPPDAPDPFIDGFLRTGDLARVDENGWVYCVGRAKRVIHRAGRTIYLEDVEAVLREDPSVLEAVVVGVAHPVFGEVSRGFVVPRPGVCPTAAELYLALKSRLSAFRLPRWITVVEALPRTRSGKPDLQALSSLPVPDVNVR